jgi:ABC-2 type transport system ATP-binding protein
LKAVPKANRSVKVKEALEVVNLSANSTQRMGRLSGGMRRRAGIAQTMVHSPDLLVLDEPSTGLDPEERVRFRELIRSIAPGRTILLSSHLVEDVRALADTVIVVDTGRIGFIGTVHELEARAIEGAAGDSDLERGYISVLASMETA